MRVRSVLFTPRVSLGSYKNTIKSECSCVFLDSPVEESKLEFSSTFTDDFNPSDTNTCNDTIHISKSAHHTTQKPEFKTYSYCTCTFYYTLYYIVYYIHMQRLLVCFICRMSCKVFGLRTGHVSFYSTDLYDCIWRDSSSKVKPKRLDCHLVAGCVTVHNPHLLHVSSWAKVGYVGLATTSPTAHRMKGLDALLMGLLREAMPTFLLQYNSVELKPSPRPNSPLD